MSARPEKPIEMVSCFLFISSASGSSTKDYWTGIPEKNIVSLIHTQDKIGMVQEYIYSLQFQFLSSPLFSWCNILSVNSQKV